MPMEFQWAPSISPLDAGGEGESLHEEALKDQQRKKGLINSISINNSIELMLPNSLNEEAVASEDVEGDENSSHHFFGGNKELLELTQSKRKDSNLHKYNQGATKDAQKKDNFG